MKRIWAAVWMAAGMVMLCGLLLYSTHRVTDRLDSCLTVLCQVEDGSEEGARLTAELREMWERQEKTMALHIRHNELEEVTLALTRVESYWQMGQYPLFRVACEEAKAAVEHLWEEARPSLKNII